MTAFYDFFRKLRFTDSPTSNKAPHLNPLTEQVIEADSVTDAATFKAGQNISFTVDDVNDPSKYDGTRPEFTIDTVTINGPDYRLYVPLSTTKIRLDRDQGQFTDEIDFRADPNSSITVDRIHEGLIVIGHTAPNIPFSQEEIEDMAWGLFRYGDHDELVFNYDDSGEWPAFVQQDSTTGLGNNAWFIVAVINGQYSVKVDYTRPGTGYVEGDRITIKGDKFAPYGTTPTNDLTVQVTQLRDSLVGEPQPVGGILYVQLVSGNAPPRANIDVAVTSTLQDVTERGATSDQVIGLLANQPATSTTTGTLRVLGGVGITGAVYAGSGAENGFHFDDNSYGGTGDTAGITLETAGSEDTRMTFRIGNEVGDQFSFYAPSITGMTLNDQVIWNAGNDGAGSGLDADFLDGFDSSYFRYRYIAIVRKGTWSRIAELNPIELFGSVTLTVQHTRGNVVVGNTFLVTFGHDQHGQITQLGSHGYTQIQVRLTEVDNNSVYFEILEEAAGGIAGDHNYTVTLDNICCEWTAYTEFTDGSSSTIVRSQFTTMNNEIIIDGNKVWHEGNDGHGSTLDADTLDGYHFSDLENRFVNVTGDVMTGSLSVNSTDYLKIPVGTTLERPEFASAGMIRYNTSQVTFEGYNGTNWGSLGGVRDVDQDTYIIPETSPGSDEDRLYFYNGGIKTAELATSTFNVLNELQVNGNKVWHAGNDGHTSGLDADTLDGKHLSEIAPAGPLGTVPFISVDNTNQQVLDYTLKIGNYIETDDELNSLKATFTDYGAIFNTWTRFSHSSSESQPASSSEINAWAFDPSTGVISCTQNTGTYVGFISPETYANYTLEVKLVSTDGDNDAISVIVGWYVDPVTGRQYTLSAIVSTGGVGPKWQIVYNYLRSDQRVLIDANSTVSRSGGWSSIPNGISIRAVRTGDTFVFTTTQMNSTTYDPSTTVTLDLTADPDLAKFRGKSNYGFGAYSQGSASFNVITFTGLQPFIYDTRDGSVWVLSGNTWSKDSSRSMYTEIGVGRFLYTEYFQKTYYIDSTSSAIKVSQSGNANDRVLRAGDTMTGNLTMAAGTQIVWPTNSQTLRLRATDDANGTLSVDGTTGQLFSVSDNYTGTIYSVNDISGISSIEVLDTGQIKLAQYHGNITIGTATDDGINKLQINGNLLVKGINEHVVSATSGTFDCSLAYLFYRTNVSGNFTANLTNFSLAADRATNVTIIIVQGGSPGIPSSLQINGSAQTINWQGGSAPSGSANKKDIVSFSIVYAAGVYTVFGQLVSYG